VANETLVGAHLTRRLHELNEAEPLDVFVVVPIKARDDSRVIDEAISNLDAGLEALEHMGIHAQGRVGPADPMVCVKDALEDHPGINLVIVSTLPLGLSRWISMDLPHRIARRFDIAVEHVVGTPLDASIEVHHESAPIKVLLVEDDEDDVELASVALQDHDDVQLLVARTGEDALAFLRDAARRPDLMLVDLKMPKMDGFTLLETFESELGIDPLNQLNVAILTSSAADGDRERAHALGAGAYIVKDPDFTAFRATLGSLVNEVRDHLAVTT
jgi:CheY-like chemotaxis protein